VRVSVHAVESVDASVAVTQNTDGDWETSIYNQVVRDLGFNPRARRHANLAAYCLDPHSTALITGHGRTLAISPPPIEVSPSGALVGEVIPGRRNRPGPAMRAKMRAALPGATRDEPNE
jgi:hypothetical protein